MTGAAWLKSHQDWGETYNEWKLYEAARAAYNLFHKRLNCWEKFSATMGESCDYGNVKLVNSTVLQCIVSCGQAILTNIWDGMSEDDVQLLVIECSKLCVACRLQTRHVTCKMQHTEAHSDVI